METLTCTLYLTQADTDTLKDKVSSLWEDTYSGAAAAAAPQNAARGAQVRAPLQLIENTVRRTQPTSYSDVPVMANSQPPSSIRQSHLSNNCNAKTYKTDQKEKIRVWGIAQW